MVAGDLDRDIRIVVILNRDVLVAWEKECLEAVRQVAACSIVGVLNCGRGRSNRVTRLSARIGTCAGPAALRRCEDPSWFSGIVVDEIGHGGENVRGRIGDEEIEWIRALAPSVIVVFDCDVIDERILGVADQGIWAFCPGDVVRYSGSPPAFWEFINNECQVGMSLVRFTGAVEEIEIIAQAFVPVLRGSPLKTVQFVYECGPALLRRALLRLREERVLHAVRPVRSRRVIGKPTFRDMYLFVRAVATGAFGWFWEKAFFEYRWRIGILTPAPSLEGETEVEPEWIPGPKKGFFADPCAVPGKDDLVLVENYERSRAKGRIDVVALPRHSAIPTRFILDSMGHLSFPQVYRVNGRLWIIPETASFGRQLAFEVDEALVPILPEQPTCIEGVMGVDPVFLRHDGRWWAFSSPGGASGSHLLNAFYATEFLGPYKAHAANPIVIDPRGGRSAGAVIECDGRLMRFGQALGRRYGEGIDVFAIGTLTPFVYQERHVGHIGLKRCPGKQRGTHGIAILPWGAVIDGYELAFSWDAGIQRLKAAVQRRLVYRRIH